MVGFWHALASSGPYMQITAIRSRLQTDSNTNTSSFSFYRAMLCIRVTSHGPVSVVCLCLSQVGVLLKRLNVGSHKQHHTIAQGL